jgi:hypothetical protein
MSNLTRPFKWAYKKPGEARIKSLTVEAITQQEARTLAPETLEGGYVRAFLMSDGQPEPVPFRERFNLRDRY